MLLPQRESYQRNKSIFGGLLSTPGPSGKSVGIALIVSFAIMGVMAEPNYDGMNVPEIGNSKGLNQENKS